MMKARYAQVSRRMVRDATFRQLSCWARAVFRDLLGHPNGDHVPGFIVDDLHGIAKNTALEESVVADAVAELESHGMLRFDAEAELFWLPKGLKHNGAANPNQVTGWARQVLLLPESPLIDEAAAALIEHAEERAEASGSAKWDEPIQELRNALETVCGTVTPTVSKHGSVSVSVDGSVSVAVDGAERVPRDAEPPAGVPPTCGICGAGYHEPCLDDDEDPLEAEADTAGENVRATPYDGISPDVMFHGDDCACADCQAYARVTAEALARMKAVHPKPEPLALVPTEGAEEHDDPLVKLPLKTPGKSFDVTGRVIRELSETYPGVDVEATARRVGEWLRNNPSKRSASARGARQRLSSWIARDVDQGRAIPQRARGTGPPGNRESDDEERARRAAAWLRGDDERAVAVRKVEEERR